MLIDSAGFLLLGMILAGLLSRVIRTETVARLAAGGRFGSSLKAALIGIPLPLCSCSVLPVATQLRRAGMNKGAVAAFLVSTPETGVDSIAVTYSLTDPVMTIARPVAAFLTAFAAGAIQSTSFKDARGDVIEQTDCSDTRSCALSAIRESRSNLLSKALSGIKYAFSDLFADLAPYLLIGYVLAGFLDAALGEQLRHLSAFWKVGAAGYVGAIVTGLPLYICATSSTPLAAVLLSYGFSPGAVLVFLLVGPATNIASLVVVRRILGVSSTLKYLAAIVFVAVICGITLDGVYDWIRMAPSYLSTADQETSALFAIILAAVLGGLILYWSIRKLSARLRKVFA